VPFGAPFHEERGEQVGPRPSELHKEPDVAEYSAVFLYYPAASVDCALANART
jgi:hypothetical protein